MSYSATSPSPEWLERSSLPELRSLMAAATVSPPKSPLPFPICVLNGGASSSGRFWREAPRLSLDSWANTDARGSFYPKEICAGRSSQSSTDRRESIASYATDETPQRWSPSIIARLMGVEASTDMDASQFEKTAELRRSASESRASTGLIRPLIMTDSSRASSNNRTQSQPAKESQPLGTTPNGFNIDSLNSHSSWRGLPPRKSFESGYFFPESKRRVSSYGEIENKLRKRGINEHTKDLETLKQILEALQLKGLLHPGKTSAQNHVTRLNFVYEDSPIIAKEPSRTPLNRRTGSDCSSSGVQNQCHGSPRRSRSNVGGNSPPRSPRREGNARSPITTGRSQTRADGNASGRRSSLPAKPKPPRMKRLAENQMASPVQPPNVNSRRTGKVHPIFNCRSPRSTSAAVARIQKKKIINVVATEDGSLSSSVSGSSATTSTDTEKEGRSSSERCDKLIHSLGKMAATDMHPSPISVLDLSFERDEAMTPSPVTSRRNIDFKDQSNGLEDATFRPVVSLAQPACFQTSDDPELMYISDVLNASSCHIQDGSNNAFMLVEKHRFLKGMDTSKLSKLQKKLIFDAVNEILDRHRLSPPWTQPSLDKVQSEFQRIRECNATDDIFGTICSILKKDLATFGWGGGQVHTSEVVLDMERMVFKDLIVDTIRYLATSSSVATQVALLKKMALFCSKTNMGWQCVN